MTNWTPVVGLWQEDLMMGLLWHSCYTLEMDRNEERDRETNRAYIQKLGIPSWSWLSCRDPIRYNLYYEPVDWEVRFEKCIVTWTGQELTSTISRAEIHGVGVFADAILGRAMTQHPLRPIQLPNGKAQDGLGTTRFTSIKFEDEAVIFPESEDAIQITCLRFGSGLTGKKDFQPMTEVVLVVKKATDRAHCEDDDHHTYERLGAGAIYYRRHDGDQLALERSSIFHGEIPRKFILV
jgi:hypothetical protein